MNKKIIITIICGIGILVTLAIMIYRLGIVAYNFSVHPEWSLGVTGAVHITGMTYGVIICILTIVLVLINVLNKKNK